MAITSSAKKAIRVSARKRIFNLRRKSALTDVTKKIKRLIQDKKIADAKALLPEVYKTIDKAVKTKYLKQNTGSRMKSRIAASLNKVS